MKAAILIVKTASALAAAIAMFLVIALVVGVVWPVHAAGPSEELRELREISEHLRSIRKSQSAQCHMIAVQLPSNLQRTCGTP